MTQFEQENELGRGGGEVDDETMDEGRREAKRRQSSANLDDDEAEAAPEDVPGSDSD